MMMGPSGPSTCRKGCVDEVEEGVPSSRKKADGGGIRVEVGRPDGVNDCVFCNRSSPKTGKRRRIAVAEGNHRPLVFFAKI